MKLKILPILTIISFVQGKTPLSSSIEHFEALSYDQSSIHQQHLRHKRALPKDKHEVQISFWALGRQFNLRLSRDFSLFHDDFHLVKGDDPTHHRELPSHYQGYLQGDADSRVFGSIREGIFDGTISLSMAGTFYVERAEAYFPLEQVNSSMHSVIYHEKHVKDPHVDFKASGCGVDSNILAWMEEVQYNHTSSEAWMEEDQYNHTSDETPEPSELPTKPIQIMSGITPPYVPPAEPYIPPSEPFHKYTAQANRVKRQTPSNSKKTCTMFIQTDVQLWRHYSKMHDNDKDTEEAILSLIANHVSAVNNIYKNTVFGQKLDGYNFVVHRIKIDKESECSVEARRNNDNKFCSSNIDVSNFLDHHSRRDHSSFCLAYMFTYRDFAGGTLGLAWVAKPTSSGGICETYKRSYADHGNAMRSLNTGIITFVNYAAKVSSKVSQLTFAHEIGHNFGSPHDFPSQCKPGGAKGNYIMFPSATPGYLDNNSQFSPCSKTNISLVLEAIISGKSRKKNCFEESDGAFCGNKIVEEGEECDCGYDDEECTEQCCYPRLDDGSMHHQACKLKKSVDNQKVFCSPSQGPCCNDDCQFVSKRKNVKCSEDDECKEDATCDGTMSKCPVQKFVDEKVCNDGAQICKEGVCSVSICEKYDLEKCWVTGDDKDLVGLDTGETARKLCYLACQERGRNKTCKTAEKWALQTQYAALNGSIMLQPGMVCDNNNGYCDVLQKCRRVDDDGPFARLKNLLFDQKSWATWMKTYWYAVIGLGVCFFVFMGLFIKCCAVHTPSSNPNMKKHIKIATTLRRPMDTIQRMDTLSRRGRGHARSSQPYSL